MSFRRNCAEVQVRALRIPMAKSDHWTADTRPKSESKPPMSKRQLIEGIQELNPTAAAPFLAQFDEGALKQYLEHLKAAQLKRVHINGWVRKRSDMRMVS